MLEWQVCMHEQSSLRDIESEKQWNVYKGTLGLVQESENGSLREQEWTCLDIEKRNGTAVLLREIRVRAIESHLYWNDKNPLLYS